MAIKETIWNLIWEISYKNLAPWIKNLASINKKGIKGDAALLLNIKYGETIKNTSSLREYWENEKIVNFNNITPYTAYEICDSMLPEPSFLPSELSIQELLKNNEIQPKYIYIKNDFDEEKISSILSDGDYILRFFKANNSRSFIDNIYQVKDNDLVISEECTKLHNEIKEKYQYSLWIKTPKEEIVLWDKEQYLLSNIDTDIYSNFNKEEYKDKIQKIKYNGKNIIFYGAPGTGKSYGIKKYIEDETGLNIDMRDDERVFRTTFHPEYSYSDFVGQVMPIVKKKDKLTYEFVPGIFTQSLKYAYENPNEPVFLILEEMSRANCAAIFGDIFQLLDRDDNGNSEYAINNIQMANYLFNDDSTKKIIIPSNLYIIGTMNTSDQNVYVMDTAFKRRFLMKYVPTKVDESQNQFNIPYNNEGASLSWNTFVEKVNSYIVSSEGLNLSEDKQIGQFFMKGKTVSYNQQDDNEEKMESKVAEDSSDYTIVLDCNKEIYKDKVLYYLYHDVEKASYNNQKTLFKNDIQSFGELYDRVSNENYDIYSDEFLKIISSSGDNDDK